MEAWYGHYKKNGQVTVMIKQTKNAAAFLLLLS